MSDSPLTVYSASNEELGRQLSNFAHTPFTLDAEVYASVEGFYSWLFWPADSPEREFVATLVGAQAQATRPVPHPEVLTYHGRSFGHRSG